MTDNVIGSILKAPSANVAAEAFSKTCGQEVASVMVADGSFRHGTYGLDLSEVLSGKNEDQREEIIEEAKAVCAGYAQRSQPSQRERSGQVMKL